MEVNFLKEALGYDGNLAVKCSNYIGESIDHAVRLGMKGILLIGHVGKLIKVAAGVMNTALQTGGLQDGSICLTWRQWRGLILKP